MVVTFLCLMSGLYTRASLLVVQPLSSHIDIKYISMLMYFEWFWLNQESLFAGRRRKRKGRNSKKKKKRKGKLFE